METLYINDRTSKNCLRPESYSYRIWWLLTASPHDKPPLFAATCATAWASLVPTKGNQKRNIPMPTTAPTATPAQQQSEGWRHEASHVASVHSHSPSIRQGQRKNSWRRKEETKLINSSLRRNMHKSLHFICQPETCIIHQLRRWGRGMRGCEATAAGSGGAADPAGC